MDKNYEKSGESAVPGPNAGSPLLKSHARLREAEKLRRGKSLDKAQAICTELLRAHPDYVGALHTLGLVLADRRDYEGARLNLSRAAMLNPRDWKILTALAGIYLRLNASEMAMRTLEHAQKLKPGDVSIVATLAEIYREEREYELAVDAYQQAHALEPSLKAARVGLGWSLNHLGRFEEAARVFSALVKDDPSDLTGLSALSQTPPGLVELDVLKGLDAVHAVPQSLEDERQTTLAFARAAALDMAKRHEEAWQELVSVNQKVYAPLTDAARKEEQARAKHLELLQNVKTQTRVPRPASERCHSLFIQGPSRSGKTTLERLSAFLPGVRRGYENPIVENAIRHTFQGTGLITRSQLVELPPQLDEVLRENYFAELDERAQGARVFTNTHPGRIVDAWRFAMAVPNSRFVFVKRDAHDLALRIFMKRYKTGHPYSYDLKAIFRYITWYRGMMDGLAARFPDIVRIVAYEDMVADPRSALATVAELCGLQVPDVSMPNLGDDRGAAAPYRDAMEKVLNTP